MNITANEAEKQILKRNENMEGGTRWSRLSFLLWFLTVVCVALTIRAVIVEPVRVKGRSMENTLFEKDYMLVEKLSYLSGAKGMHRGDIIICYFPQNNEYSCVKRIIGLPGEGVKIENGAVYINKDPENEDSAWIQIDEPYVTTQVNSFHDGEWIVEENTVFALGDHRRVSHDSSARDVGCIPMERVIGRVRCTLFPFKRAQTFPHVDYQL